MVEYAGFEMPVQYSGVLEEHLTVRSKVGIFDLTHMGEFELRGPGALVTVNHLITNDAARLKEGEILYSPLTSEDGGIIDDILVYRRAESFLLVVNAANAAKDLAWIQSHLLPDTEFLDRSDELTLIAVQGPQSEPLMEEVLGLSLHVVAYGLNFLTVRVAVMIRDSFAGSSQKNGEETLKLGGTLHGRNGLEGAKIETINLIGTIAQFGQEPVSKKQHTSTHNSNRIEIQPQPGYLRKQLAQTHSDLPIGIRFEVFKQLMLVKSAQHRSRASRAVQWR
jgi:hypothetical protein